MRPGAPVVHVQKVSGISGSERHLLGLLPDLRERGWDTRAVVLHESEQGAQDFVHELLAADVPVTLLRMRGDVDPVTLVRLTAHFARTRPAIVHTHLVHADFYALTAAALARVPLRVTTKHGFDEFRHRRAFAAADRLVARFAHRQIAVSEGLARYLADVEGFDHGSFDVIHYGITPGDEPPAPTPAQAPLVCVGRLIPIKGHSVLLDALARARADCPELTLEIVGAGELEPELRRVADRLGLDGAVRFAGRAWPVEPALERASVVVVPSLGEGFGRVALEAMERGRPVIASRVGGLAEIVDDGVTGLLVPPGEPQPLADAIVRLARDAELARSMGEAGRRRAVERFAERMCTERTELVYRSALGP